MLFRSSNRARCTDETCDKHPVFGFPGSKPTRCKDHKDGGMVDVMNPRCTHGSCRTILSKDGYGFPGQKVHLCMHHKETQPGVIKAPRSRCRESTCKNPALWGVDIPTHCDLHTEAGERNLVELECPSCNLTMLLDPTSGLCEFCDPTKTPPRDRKSVV